MEHNSPLQIILDVVEGWLPELLGATETSLHFNVVEGDHETTVYIGDLHFNMNI